MSVDLISGLLSSLVGVDVRDLDDEELTQRNLAVNALLEVLQAHAAELGAEFQQRGLWSVDGASSGAAWLAARSTVRRAEIAGRARVGATLRQLPAVAAAVKSGEIGFDHVRLRPQAAVVRAGGRNHRPAWPVLIVMLLTLVHDLVRLLRAHRAHRRRQRSTP